MRPVALTLVEPSPREYRSISENAQENDITGMLDHMAHAHVLKESSLNMYRRDFAAYMEYVNKHGYSPVDPTMLENWRDDLINEGKSPNTINRELAAVKRVMKEAAKPRYRLISTSAAYEFEHIDGASMDILTCIRWQPLVSALLSCSVTRFTCVPSRRGLYHSGKGQTQ